MPYDPFRDYAKCGYLRNIIAAKRRSRIKALEHATFLLHIEEAMTFLANTDAPLTYDDVRAVHRTLFIDFYPWAGQDRFQLDVSHYSARGDVPFEQSNNIRRAMAEALRMGNNPEQIRAKPGAVLGLMAWAHPFLDGNGRAILTTHGELCRRAGFAIDWEHSHKHAYLAALARELKEPSAGHLDTYLRPLIVPPRPLARLLETYQKLPGLKGDEDSRPQPARRLVENATHAEGKLGSVQKKHPRPNRS